MPNARQMSANVYFKKNPIHGYQGTVYNDMRFIDRQVGDSPKELQKLNRVNPTPNYPVFFILCISLLENTNNNADRSINLDTPLLERPYNYKTIPSFAAVYRFEGPFLHTLAPFRFKSTAI